MSYDESQWIQSAMGYNRDTTAFNYTQNATSIPSMQLGYSRFMDSLMTASQPTLKYPAYAASSPSSVQPTAQGAGGGSVWAAIPKGLGETWDDVKNSVKGAWSDVKAVGSRAWHDVTNPADLMSDIQKLGDNLVAYERDQQLAMGVSAAYAMMPATAEGRSYLMAPIKAYLSEPAALEVEQATHTLSKLGLFAAATVLTDGAVDYVGTRVAGAGLDEVLSRGVSGSASKVGFFSGSNTGISISASSPSEIAWGYGKLSSRQSKLLESLQDSGDYIQLHKSGVNAADLAALTAQTGDEFAMFTLSGNRIVVRGNSQGLDIRGYLADKLQSQDWTWSAHTHPGLSDNVLMASGSPGDRSTLQLFGQKRSMILNSAGRRSIFDLENDYAITDSVLSENLFSLGASV